MVRTHTSSFQSASTAGWQIAPRNPWRGGAHGRIEAFDDYLTAADYSESVRRIASTGMGAALQRARFRTSRLRHRHPGLAGYASRQILRVSGTR
jgi:hypothetical protein